MFSKETYIQRRKRLMEQMGSGLLLFLGNDESPMNYPDNPYFFRQDSSFLYFFGIDHPGLAAVIDVDEGREVLFGDDLSVDDIVWMGRQPLLREKAGEVGVEQTLPSGELISVLKKARGKGQTIHFLPPYRDRNRLKLWEMLEIHPAESVSKASIDLIKAVVAQRNIKSQEEIAEIERAVEITSLMHRTAIEMARPGMKEAEIAGAIEGIAVSAGGYLSFPVILTVHGETLHNHYHGNTLRDGDLVLNDSGAETAIHYAGDMSRTFPAGKKFTSRQKEIYRVALEAHEAAIDALKPGIRFKEIHLLAAKTLARGLKDLGFMKGDVDEAVAQGAHALFFPCGLGHMMGLDVHDMEDLGEQYVGYSGEEKSTQFGLKSLRLARELEPGFVLTIEPGIYFIPELIDMWKAEGRFTDFIDYDKVNTYRDFGGLRSEENFVITDTGARLLGTPVAKKPEEVEALRQ